MKNSSAEMSKIGFGAATLGEEYGPIDEQDDFFIVKRILELGYEIDEFIFRINFFDTAPYYGRLKSETRLGIALERALKNTGVNREDIFVSTKVGRYDVTKFDFSKDAIRKSVTDSLNRLKTDYLDLCICHDVEFVDKMEIIQNALPVLNEYKQQGIIRNIGISGYPLPTLLEIATQAHQERLGIDFVLSYCHCTLQNNQLIDYKDKFKTLGIKIINASPMSMGLLTRSGPPEWHPASKEILNVVRDASVLCDSLGSNLSKLALQYSVKNADFAETTLVGMSSVTQVEESVKWVSEELDSVLLQKIEAILNSEHNKTW